jgi:hypothetical protein
MPSATSATTGPAGWRPSRSMRRSSASRLSTAARSPAAASAMMMWASAKAVLGRGKDRVAKSRISLQGSAGGPTPQSWQRHRNALLSATAPVAAERATPGRMLSS